jgi:hypothetical protein
VVMNPGQVTATQGVPEECLAILRSMQVPGDGDSLRLVDVEKPFSWTRKCNIMWDLRNSKWIPEFNKADVRFAHPAKNDHIPFTTAKFHEMAKRHWNVTKEPLWWVSKEGLGCNGVLVDCYFNFMMYHVLGWVDCVRRVDGKEEHEYMYPSGVTTEYMKTLLRVIVPCHHLQLYFQVMMGQTLLPRETVRFGFVNYHDWVDDVNRTRYFVERVETRTDSPLPTWDLEDIQSLLQFWDKEIAVFFFSPGVVSLEGEYERPEVRDTMGDVGVKETTYYATSIREGFTPANFLGCSYLHICEFSQSTKFVSRLRLALLRRMPEHADIRLTYHARGKYHVLQQWSSLRNNESGEDKSDEEFDSDTTSS